MSDVLKLEGVSVRRGDNRLLDGLSVKIEEGQHWAVLGPNGAGKTTFLEIAAGRLFPTQGEVEILGERLGRVDVFELRPRIGYASASLARHIPTGETVADAVVTAAYGVLGRWTEEYDELDVERAHDLLSAFGVDELAERRFGSLSEGEKKRVQIARSLMTDPELLLLDEPASGLDLGGREELLAALTEILSDRHAPATIMVTHHVEEIPAGTTHLLLIKRGRAVAAGTLEEALTQENLSEAFGMPISLAQSDGRYHAQATA
ncbi:ATP-binding cassette domain-containing protein [Brevibacterium sp. 5221]|uniref:ATP-binding cassette domain-containing protein n=1 Tax=Brevibacterium rongguiense TaxID=2695267 RepID=A0A6N9H4X1_9MICO|nr:ABC transporter ATP-binding protein [Brevibacterium rongguiense]MYM18969.1 ATP-binding cassette domain-containing protein [Brevibacterium rongguiense]